MVIDHVIFIYVLLNAFAFVLGTGCLWALSGIGLFFACGPPLGLVVPLPLGPGGARGFSPAGLHAGPGGAPTSAGLGCLRPLLRPWPGAARLPRPTSRRPQGLTCGRPVGKLVN